MLQEHVRLPIIDWVGKSRRGSGNRQSLISDPISHGLIPSSLGGSIHRTCNAGTSVVSHQGDHLDKRIRRPVGQLNPSQLNDISSSSSSSSSSLIWQRRNGDGIWQLDQRGGIKQTPHAESEWKGKRRGATLPLLLKEGRIQPSRSDTRNAIRFQEIRRKCSEL